MADFISSGIIMSGEFLITEELEVCPRLRSGTALGFARGPLFMQEARPRLRSANAGVRACGAEAIL
jgi:hypothetical protein